MSLLHNLFLTQFPFNSIFQTSRFVWLRIHLHREPEGNSSHIHLLFQTTSQYEIYKGVRVGSVHRAGS